jgi:ribosomal protein S18 acetylase RimI-like enzyme
MAGQLVDISIRDANPDDADSLAHVLISAMQGAFRGLVPEYCLQWPNSAANWRQSLTEGLGDDTFLIAAQTADTVVAYAMGGRSDDPTYRGELKQLMVLPSHQRQGIGRLLACETARRLAALGIESMCVKVLKANPHRLFYERLGGVFVREAVYDWDGVPMPEYTYGWKDVQQLVDG